MVPATTPLMGFNGEIIWPIGQISLLTKIGDGKGIIALAKGTRHILPRMPWEQDRTSKGINPEKSIILIFDRIKRFSAKGRDTIALAKGKPPFQL